MTRVAHRDRGHLKPRGESAERFWQIPAVGWKDVLKRTWDERGEDNISLLAAGVAFYCFLAFVPLLAAIVLLYGVFADPADVARHINTLMHVLPVEVAEIIGDQLKALTETPVSRTTLGLIVAIFLALYGAMRGATSLISALNIIYDERETRSFVRTTGLSFAFTLGAVLIAIIASIAIGALALVGKLLQLPTAFASLVTLTLWIATAFGASLLVAILYRYGPDRENARWTWLAPGSLFASLGALLATFLFGLYISHFGAYNATYGALGAVVSFLMWLYVTAFVVLLGAELNAELEHQTSRDTTIGAPVPEGQRGATMADTPPPQSPVQPAPEPPKPSMSPRPIVAGIAAARITRLTGQPVGTLPLSLVTAGASILLKRGDPKKAFACLGLGALLIWRSRQSAEKGTSDEA